MPRFAANLSMMFQEIGFLDRFDAAARAGFKGVEFLFPYEHPPEVIAARLEKNRLILALFNTVPGDWAGGERGLASLPGREAEFRDGVARALEYAQALGTKRLHAMAGLVPDGASRERHREVFIGNLRFAARELGRHGITLLIEPINGRDMPGYFLNRQADAHAICEAVGEPNLKGQIEFYHAMVVEGDLATSLSKFIAM